MGPIRFGTDGWRAKMGDEFSFKNVRIFAQGYSNYLKIYQKTKDIKIIVNFDTRFLSKKFALEAAKIFSLNGIKTFIPNRDVPLAPISLAIVQNKLNGGINFTASFNKPVYNGIKAFNSRGAPAMPSETVLIEKEIEKIAGDFDFKPQYENSEMIHTIDVKEPYIKYIEGIVNFNLIKNSGVKIIVDNLFGTSREYLDYLLSENDIDILCIHNFPYSTIGNIIPSCNKESLKELSKLVIKRKADIGLATDIDGDRFGIIDSRGKWLDSNLIMPPLIEYLIKVRKMEGAIVKSISTTDNIKKVADYYLRKVYVTPVGFKYLADMMFSRKAFIAIESTNGASLSHKITIKDGILFNLLVTEMLAYYKLEMEKILHSFYMKFPKLYSKEISIRKNKNIENRYNKLISQKEISFKGLFLKEINYIDGIKFIFDDSWLLIRESGTNEVFRIYAESSALKKTENLIKLGRSLIE